MKSTYICVEKYYAYDISFEVYKKYYIEIKRENYIMYVDDEESLTSPVYKFSCRFDEDNFIKSFISISEYRNDKIKNFLE